MIFTFDIELFRPICESLHFWLNKLKKSDSDSISLTNQTLPWLASLTLHKQYFRPKHKNDTAPCDYDINTMSVLALVCQYTNVWMHRIAAP